MNFVKVNYTYSTGFTAVFLCCAEKLRLLLNERNHLGSSSSLCDSTETPLNSKAL